MKKCPHCGAKLDDNAIFCLYCMQDLTPKAKVAREKPKMSKSKKIIICICAVLSIAVAAVSIFSVFSHNKEKLTDFEGFKECAVSVSDRLNCNDLWNPENLIDTYKIKSQTIYKTDTAISEKSTFTISFPSSQDGEIDVAIKNIPKDKIASANLLAECVTDSIYGYYLTDIGDFISDNDAHPLIDSGYAYKYSLAEVTGSNDVYANDIKNGATITSMMKEAQLEDSKIKMQYELRTRTYPNMIYYDIIMCYFLV